MEDDDKKVVFVDFTYRPDDDFRSQMVDVFKRYFVLATEDGIPSSLTVDMVLAALSQAVDEEQKTPWVFQEAFCRFAQAKYGYRVITDHEFDRLKREIEAKIVQTAFAE